MDNAPDIPVGDQHEITDITITEPVEITKKPRKQRNDLERLREQLSEARSKRKTTNQKLSDLEKNIEQLSKKVHEPKRRSTRQMNQ